jgi:hypothetical protein
MSDAQRQAMAQEVRAQADSFLAAFRQLNAQPYLDQLANNQSYAENGAFYPTRDSLLSVIRQFPAMYTAIEVAWDGEPRVTVLGTDAVVFSSGFRETLQPKTGAATKAHGIWTGVYQRVNGRWSIVQAHESYVPDEPAPKGR